jgi:hypothetical protein
MANTQPAVDPYLGDAENDLRQEAAFWSEACYCKGEPGYCNPDKASWRYEPYYDITKLYHLNGHEWLAWFKEEQKMAADDGRVGYYDSMLDEPIQEAIIVLERDGKGYIWDGWHRTGAAITKDLKTIRAIVGTP